MKSSKTAALQNEIAITVCTKNRYSKIKDPSKKAVLASLEGRFLCNILEISYFATGPGDSANPGRPTAGADHSTCSRS